MTVDDFAKLDWYGIQQCLLFLRDYPEIGWHGKARERLSPPWTRAFDDIEFLNDNMEELVELVRQAKANSKFYNKGRGDQKKE